ncbi:unnamed protein product [Urochloa humidicola]
MYSSPPPPPGGRACRRLACRRHREAALTRDWAAGLPADVLLAILHRLDHIEILMSADRVCRSWQRAAREEPSLRRRIGMTSEAVRRAAGPGTTASSSSSASGLLI